MGDYQLPRERTSSEEEIHPTALGFKLFFLQDARHHKSLPYVVPTLQEPIRSSDVKQFAGLAVYVERETNFERLKTRLNNDRSPCRSNFLFLNCS
jgi:hypothetical protein